MFFFWKKVKCEFKEHMEVPNDFTLIYYSVRVFSKIGHHCITVGLQVASLVCDGCCSLSQLNKL